MTTINSKMGITPAGARARLNSLSGVMCQSPPGEDGRVCRHVDVVSVRIHNRLQWCCGWCSYQWEPTDAELARYNDRVRERDQILRNPSRTPRSTHRSGGESPVRAAARDAWFTDHDSDEAA